MSARTRSMNQAATYWAPGSNDGYGDVSFSAPIAILCRWENKKTLFIDEAGQEKTSEAVIYPNQELALGGFLYKGTSTEASPSDVSGSREIRGDGQSPNLRATKELNKVFL